MGKRKAERNDRSAASPQKRPPPAQQAARTMTDDEFLRLKLQIKSRQKENMTRPKIFMSDYKLGQLLQPIDIQSLLLFAAVGNEAPFKPNWCTLLRSTKLEKICLVVLHGLSEPDARPDSVVGAFLRQKFEMKVDVLSADSCQGDVWSQLFVVPWNAKELRKFEKQQSRALAEAEAAGAAAGGCATSDASAAGPVAAASASGKLRKTELILSAEQLLSEGFPLPGFLDPTSRKYMFTKSDYEAVHDASPLFAVDCEMCMSWSNQLELTRVSLVDEGLNTVFDSLVMPPNPIKDYLTRYSGITKQMMKDVTTTLADVQLAISQLLPSDAILCGQSLDNDLRALELFHPYVIDTSVIFNKSGSRGRKTSLKELSRGYLSKSIQKETHCSVEDAKAAMELVRLKLGAEELHFGDRAAMESNQLLWQRQAAPCASDPPARAAAAHPPDRTLFQLVAAAGVTLVADADSIVTVQARGVLDNLHATHYDLVCVDTNKCALAELLNVVRPAGEAAPGRPRKLVVGNLYVEPDAPSGRLRRIRKYIARLVDQMPDRSLLMLYLPGCAQLNGCCFVHVTNFAASDTAVPPPTPAKGPTSKRC